MRIILGMRLGFTCTCHKRLFAAPYRPNWADNPSDCNGFTLLELMVVLAVMSILTLLAIPDYSEQTRRGSLVAVQGDLLTCAQSMQARAMQTHSWEGMADSDDDGVGDADQGVVARELCQPISMAQGHYQLLVDTTGSGFELTAQPAVPGPMAALGALTLDHVGFRTWDRDNNGQIDDDETRW